MKRKFPKRTAEEKAWSLEHREHALRLAELKLRDAQRAAERRGRS